MKFPASAVSMTETLVTSLRADLLACRLMTGTKQKITELALSLAASRGAVREALSRLTAEGLVVAEAQRGFRAAEVSAADFVQLMEAGILIESSCIRESLQNADIGWEGSLIGAFHRLSRAEQQATDAAGRSSDEWAQAHEAFHACLVSACRNKWLLQIRSSLFAKAQRYHHLSMRVDRSTRDSLGEHMEMRDSALAREIDLTIALMTRHLRRTTTILSSAPELGDSPSRDAEDRPFPAGTSRVDLSAE